MSLHVVCMCLWFGWLFFTFHGQRGHSETASPFTVPCKGREALFLHHSHREFSLILYVDTL